MEAETHIHYFLHYFICFLLMISSGGVVQSIVVSLFDTSFLAASFALTCCNRASQQNSGPSYFCPKVSGSPVGTMEPR